MKRTITKVMFIVAWLSVSVALFGPEKVNAQTTLYSETFSTSLASTTPSNGASGNWIYTNSCGKSALGGHTAPGSAVFSGAGCQYGNGSATVSGDLITPAITLPPTNSSTLSFNYAVQNECGTSGTCFYDILAVQISTNNGVSYSNLANTNGGGMFLSSGWLTYTTNLTAYAGQTIRLRFNFNSGDGVSNAIDGIYVDDILIQTCTASTPLTANSGTINIGQSFTITPTGPGTYSYLPTGPVVSPTTTSYYTAISTLTAGCYPSAVSVVSVNAGALNFDGTNDIVNCGTAINSSLNGSAGLTAEAWIRPSALPAFANIVSNHNLGGSSFALRSAGTQLNAFVGFGTYTINTAVGTLSTNVWQHVAMVFNGTSISTFINGVPTGSVSFPSYTLPASTNSVVIGNNPYNEAFNGNMDEVRIWNRALCQGEIQNSMMGQLSLPQTSLVAYYQFNQGFIGFTNSTTTLVTAMAGPTGTASNMALIGATSNWVASSVSSNSNVAAFVSPTLAIASPTAICNGSSTTLTASGVSSYTWTSGPTTATFAVTPSVTTTYSVVGTATNACLTNVTTQTINVNAIPTVAVNNGTICSGSTFTMVPTGAGTYTIQGGSAAVSPTANASYTVIGTSTAGCVSANTATSNVTVNAAPIVSANNGTICNGNTFTIVPSGANTYTIQGGNTVVSPTANASYTVIGTNSVGCVSANTATSSVTVNANPTVTTVSNASLICNGQTATLTASGANTYVWNTTATTAVIAVSPTTTTSYTVTGTNAAGCSANAVLTQSVNACTGINSNVLASNILVYPNPSNGIFNVQLENAATIEVTDVLGRVILTDKVNAGNYQLNLGNNVNGVYFVKATVDGKTKTVKIVKE
ncbi:MAG: LamG-like jellyroll fold domain-containing protein [Sphingobacteriaceae bacterium]